MFAIRSLAVFAVLALAARAATFGTIVPVLGGATDLALDEPRGRVYITSSVQNLVQIYSLQSQALLTPIGTDQTPLSAALSLDGKFLYVTCYNSSVLDVIDLTALTVATRISLPAKPEGVAVGADGRALISTTGSGTTGATNVLLIYDPSPNAASPLTSISVTPPAPAAPTFPSPSGRPFLSTHSQLIATHDGSFIAGVNAPSTGSPTVFVYEAASDTVLRSRAISGSTTALAISDDGTRVMSGANLFDATTLRVLAQENLANSPYPITPGTSFATQANQGGSVFSPDGTTLYAAFNILPVQVPAAPANTSQLMMNDPDNLVINMGLQLPENLDGKIVISSDGSAAYALSDSGFTILPVGTISQSVLAVPSTAVAMLTSDACDVTAQTASATVTINNSGKGRITATAQLLQYTGQTSQASPTTAPSVKSLSSSSPQFTFSFNSAAAKGLGTIVPPHDFLIQSPTAINIPDRVRVYENSRNPEARGSIVPIPVGISSSEFLSDIAYDSVRQRIYIANAGLNRVEVYDLGQQQLLSPIKVGQFPNSLALTPEGDTLYVANSGGESISIVDPNMMKTIGSVSLPPLSFNSTLALETPSVIAAGLSGLQIVMSDGSLWEAVGGIATLRGVSVVLGATSTGLPVKLPMPSSMAATPDGEFIIVATSTGLVYLYDAMIDDFVSGRQVFTASTQTGYIGPVAAGPQGSYFVVNGTVLNQELVTQGTVSTQLVSAAAPVGNSTYALFSPPATASATTEPTTAPTIQIMSTQNGGAAVQVSALEGPPVQVTSTGRASINGRTMVIDSAGANAYAITTSGLSIIPLATVSASERPVIYQGGAVNLASYQLPVAANGLLTIFGGNLAANGTATSIPVPVLLGGTCVTLNDIALPLFYTTTGQINAQIPPNLAAGTYPLVVRSITNLAASASYQLAVSKYGPAVLVGGDGQLALFHADGSYVSKSNPANRDEPLTMYAVGLGPTTGGSVVAGEPSPSSPLAVTGTVAVYFGDPLYKQAAIIVDWSGLTPGVAGVYQLNLRVPGFHISGDALPVTLEVGGVSSPTAGPVVPYVAVN